jgi:nitroreductase
MDRRRTVRSFAPDPVPWPILRECLRAGGTAPSGAHKQPWTWVAVRDPRLKRAIREAAEAEERVNYERRFPPEWKQDLAPLGTDFVKEHITTAPWVVVLFEQVWAIRPDGSSGKHYYVPQSVGIALGMFLVACHEAGLATLVHTPSPMGFLARILGRPKNEKAFALVPVGHPAPDCRVPDLRRKLLEEFVVLDPPMVEGVARVPGEDPEA